MTKEEKNELADQAAKAIYKKIEDYFEVTIPEEAKKVSNQWSSTVRSLQFHANKIQGLDPNKDFTPEELESILKFHQAYDNFFFNGMVQRRGILIAVDEETGNVKESFYDINPFVKKVYRKVSNIKELTKSKESDFQKRIKEAQQNSIRAKYLKQLDKTYQKILNQYKVNLQNFKDFHEQKKLSGKVINGSFIKIKNKYVSIPNAGDLGEAYGLSKYKILKELNLTEEQMIDRIEDFILENLSNVDSQNTLKHEDMEYFDEKTNTIQLYSIKTKNNSNWGAKLSLGPIIEEAKEISSRDTEEILKRKLNFDYSQNPQQPRSKQYDSLEDVLRSRLSTMLKTTDLDEKDMQKLRSFEWRIT